VAKVELVEKDGIERLSRGRYLRGLEGEADLLLGYGCHEEQRRDVIWKVG